MPGRASRSRGVRVTRLDDLESRQERLCFGDEVVVDFPSMAPAVDRIRRAFLYGERLAAFRTPLALSSRQAREGAVVPLAVPMRFTCRACAGRGETWGSRCHGCAGSGSELRQRDVRVSVPPGVQHGDRFHFSLMSSHDAPTRIELQILLA